MDLKQKLVSVARQCQLTSDQFNALGIYDWPEIFKKIETAYIIKENSNTKFNWWWEHLKGDSFSLAIPREKTHACLQYLIPLQEKAFFIGCENERDPSKFWLFEGQIGAILQVMDEVPAFEYYLVSKKYEWFLAMNHHDYLIGLGSMKDRLKQLASSHHF